MSKWKLKLKSGVGLRAEILKPKTDTRAVCTELSKCYVELIGYFADQPEKKKKLATQKLMIDNSFVGNASEDPETKKWANDRLKDFYDFCDQNQVWVEL